MVTPLNFPPFHPTIEMWILYINRFQCVMDATNLSDIPPNRKKAYFLKIQKSSSLPGAKPNSTVHYAETYFEEEYFEEEAVNHLKTPQPIQRRSLPTDKRQFTPQLICLSYGGNHLRTTCHFRNAVCLKCQRKVTWLESVKHQETQTCQE
ncbi:hypothetical protein E2320_001817, partial [Naja naja]